MLDDLPPQLRKLLMSNPQVLAICKAAGPFLLVTTDLDVIAATGCDKLQAVALLKLIAETGAGEFIKARTTKNGEKHHNRLAWNMILAPNWDNQLRNTCEKPKAPLTITAFKIRPELTLSVPFPLDMTREERDRYVAFIQSQYYI